MVSKDQKQMLNEKARCQIAGCEELVPADNPKDSFGQIIALCPHHLDMLKVFIWGLQHIKFQPPAQKQTPPPIVIPGLNVPRNFDPRGN